ncbi:MAG: FG-GAP repeat protein [Candidatus Sumerlaeaceae bacterium]
MVHSLRNTIFAGALLCCAPLIAQDAVTLEPWDLDLDTASARFGQALAASSKYLYVGAPGYDRVPAGAGAGWVHTFDSKTLDGFVRLNTPIQANQQEGWSLATTKFEVLVGYPGKTAGGFGHAGEAMYYNEKIGNSPTLSNPAPATNDEFGKSVAMSTKLMVIGAPGDVGGTEGDLSGSAFVARKTDFVVQRLPLPSYEDGDRAGAAVAVSTRFIAVGAPGALVGSTPNTGVVYIYDAKTLAYITTIIGGDFLNGPLFGSAVAFSGKHLFVGAPAQHVGNPFLGFVFSAGAVFQYETKTWTAVRVYNSASPQSNADFGASLSVDSKRIAIGSPRHDEAASNGGKAELFDLKLGAFIGDFRSPVPVSEENYGASVLLMKGNRLAVGAPAPTSTSTDGKAYVYPLGR